MVARLFCSVRLAMTCKLQCVISYTIFVLFIHVCYLIKDTEINEKSTFI